MKKIPLQKRFPYWLIITSTLAASIFSSVNPRQASATSEDSANALPSLQTENIVFAVIGDYGIAGQAEADVANLVKSWNPNFIVTVGDNNYENGLAETIDQNIGQYYHDYIFRYTGKYGAGSPTNRFFPALGNHDWGNNGIRPYLAYFTLPGNERYYDFVSGPVHFFILDSDPKEPDDVSSTGKQAGWLKNGLAASTSTFNIVIAHHAPYSSGRHGPNTYMQWPFKTWGAHAVLSGHDHTYERLLISDLVYFVNGLGGDTPYNFGTTVVGSQVRFNKDYGAMRVEANSVSMKFQFYTRANILVDEYTITKNVPIVNSILRAAASPTNASTINYSVTFSEPVTGVDVSDFQLTATGISGASVTSVSGADATYTVSVNTGSGSGSLRLDILDDDSILDATNNPLGSLGAGNGNFSNGESYVVDKIPPVVTAITRAGASPTYALNVDFNIVFSEPMSGINVSDFKLETAGITGASVNSVSGAGTNYVVSVNTGSGNGTVRLDVIDNDAFTDTVGNKLGGDGAGNGNFTGEAFTIDKSIPKVISIARSSPSLTNAASVDFVVTFSASVSGVDPSDFFAATNLNSASIGAVSGSGNIYIVTALTGSGDGTLQINLIDDDSILNEAGTPLGDFGKANGDFSGGESYTIDRTAPVVTSIIRSSGNPSTSSSVSFIVTFSESVIGVEQTDFSLFTNSISGTFIEGVSPSDPFYVVSVNTGDGTGNLRLDVIDHDNITDLAGNFLGGLGSGNGNYINGETYTIEKSAPGVTSIISAGSNPSNASNIDFIVTFSESVSGVDAADFNLTTQNILNASIITVNNFDPFYIVSVNTGVGMGTLRLDFLDNDSVQDASGNKPGGDGIGNGSFFNGQTISIVKAQTNFPPPTLRDPKRNFLTNNSRPEFSWMRVRNAAAYEISIASDNNFTNILATQVVNGVSYTHQSNLADGIYFWRVRAYGPDLQPGKDSANNSFIVDTSPPVAPGLISPVNDANISARLKFSWFKIQDATRYQIEIDNNSDFSSPEWSSIRSEPSYQILTFRSGRYFWRVRAKDMAGNWGAWSFVNVFNIR